jgi:hypothetical protein
VTKLSGLKSTMLTTWPQTPLFNQSVLKKSFYANRFHYIFPVELQYQIIPRLKIQQFK